VSVAHAQVWQGGTDFQLREIPLPALGEGEALVQLTAATICGSDRHTVSGRRSGACPSILGHEGVGIVVDSRRPGLEPGMRVVFSVTSSCGRCGNCRRGLTAKCDTVLKAGHESFEEDWPLSGTYASHIHLLAGQAVEEVPEHVSDALASTAGCAAATVMAVLDSAGDLAGRRVLVNGIGMLGVIAVAAARSRGAMHVIACDPNPVNRGLVDGLADVTVAPGTDHTVDVALELSGATAGVKACLSALDIGGTAVLAGTVAPGPDVAVDPEWLVRGWRTVTGVHNFEPRHLTQAVDFLAAHGHTLPTERIFGGPVPLEQLPGQFVRPDGTLRTVVELQPSALGARPEAKTAEPV
jgi:putative phosphonate catabolism associated alcohol dehydrogenase